MKLRFTYLALLLALCASSVFAQSSFHDTVVSHVVDPGAAAGGNYWIAIPQNYYDESGKFIHLLLTSPVNTTAFIQLGTSGPIDSITIAAYHAITFNTPIGWEMKSSGMVENKAVHVWADNPNLTIFLLLHDPYTSDGTFLMPTSEWGRDYVVAARGFLIDGFGTYEEIPCNFTISASLDNTIVEITPSCDLRKAPDLNQNNSVVAYPKGKKFIVNLDRGQSIQFLPIRAEDNINFDVTGTILRSCQPIGVIGASQCANIPGDYPYCDFVCHSLLPISSWGNMYYSAPFVQTNFPTLQGHDSSMFLIVSSKDSQTIHRYDCATGDHTECTIDTALKIKWIEEAKASKWYSDAPFQLVQYINSSTYPDDNVGTGDPAEVALDPKENWNKSVLFLIPDTVKNVRPYDNYANIFFNVNAAKSTVLDSVNILEYTSTCLGDSMAVAVVPHIKPGAHLVTSDSAVSVYTYGYGYDESYAWSGGMGNEPYSPFKPKDSISPSITFSRNFNCMHVSIADSGTCVSELFVDSTFNMSFALDPTFINGGRVANTFADICFGYISDFAYARFTVFDGQGNVSVGTLTYSPDKIISSPGFTLASQAFDTTLAGTTKTLPVLTIVDTSSQYSAEIDSIKTDGPDFIYYDSIPGNALPVVLAPGMSRTFSLTFVPSEAAIYVSHAYAIDRTLPVRETTIKGIGYGIAEVAQTLRTELHATLTPNPAAKSVSLNFSLPQTASVTFELSSIDGNKVLAWKADAQSNGDHLQKFDISSLPTGSYIYRFSEDDRSSTNGQVLSGKLIINR